MRSRKALVNTLAGLALEVVTVACGFILPRLILACFGSAYNGITSSISQFLGCAALLKAGASAATRAALYKPLAQGDTSRVSSILRANRMFMQRVAWIFAGALLVFAGMYPFLVRHAFGWLFSASLVVILGIGTFMQYSFGTTYQVLLQADQRQCVYSFVQILTVLLNTLLSVGLIRMGTGIHWVKLGSALAYSLNPLLLGAYVRRRYRIDPRAGPDNTALKGRWDALAHEVAAFIKDHTDLILLTVCTNLLEVSVYTVYYMVIRGVRQLILTFTGSLGAAFGNMLARGETHMLEDSLRIFEMIAFTASTLCFTVAGLCIVDFAGVYTIGVTDADYVRPVLGWLFSITGLVACLRMPYQTIVLAAGHFRQTRNGAFLEAGLNLVLSLILVMQYGLAGVVLGTLLSAAVRTVELAAYVSRRIIQRSQGHFVKRLLVGALNCFTIIVLVKLLPLEPVRTWTSLVWRGGVATGLGIASTALYEVVFFRGDMRLLARKLRKALQKR